MRQYLFLVFSLLVITGCSTSKLAPSSAELNALKSQTQQSNKTVTDLRTEYTQALGRITDESLSFYSPLHILNAQESAQLAEADKHQAKFHLLSALKSIEHAANIKKAVKLHLKKSDRHFIELQNLNTLKFFPDDFKQISIEFSELISFIEQGDTQAAIGREESLISSMLNLEINTLTRIHLDEARTFLKQALALEAEEYAPSSILTAKKALQDTEQFIKTAYRDRHGIKKRALTATQLAEKSFYVTQQAHIIHTSNHTEIENLILDAFVYLDKIKSALDINETDVLSYPLQQKNVLSLLKTKTNTYAENPELLACKQQIDRLNKQIKQLEQESAYRHRSIISEETHKAILPELSFD